MGHTAGGTSNLPQPAQQQRLGQRVPVQCGDIAGGSSHHAQKQLPGQVQSRLPRGLGDGPGGLRGPGQRTLGLKLNPTPKDISLPDLSGEAVGPLQPSYSYQGERGQQAEEPSSSSSGIDDPAQLEELEQLDISQSDQLEMEATDDDNSPHLRMRDFSPLRY